MLDLQTAKEVERDPLFGQLFENMVVANIRKNQFNAGHVRMGTAGMYFLRDKTGNEVDVALEVSGRQRKYTRYSCLFVAHESTWRYAGVK